MLDTHNSSRREWSRRGRGMALAIWLTVVLGLSLVPLLARLKEIVATR